MDVLSKLKFPEDDFSVYWFEYLLNTLYVPICGNRNATCASCDQELQSRSRLKLFAESLSHLRRGCHNVGRLRSHLNQRH
jgi:hypothetical protein